VVCEKNYSWASLWYFCDNNRIFRLLRAIVGHPSLGNTQQLMKHTSLVYGQCGVASANKAIIPSMI